MYDVLVLTTWRNREKEINHGAPLMLILAEACHPREPEEVTEPLRVCMQAWLTSQCQLQLEMHLGEICCTSAGL